MTAPRNKYLWLEGLWLLDLSGERLRVLGAIQSAHRDGVSLISTAEIVKRTGLSRSAASRNLKAAERQKLVSVEWSKGGSRPHRITLLDPAMAVLDCGSKGAAVEKDGDCGSMAAAETAALTQARVEATLTLAGAPPAGAPQPTPVCTSEASGRGSISSPPVVATGDVGDDIAPADAEKDSPSNVDADPTAEGDWSDDEEDAEPTYDEKLDELRDLVSDLVRYEIRLPKALEDFLEVDLDLDLDEDELDRLLESAHGAFDAENERVEADNAEIDAARAAVAARTAATLIIAPSVPMTFYVDHMAVAAVTLSTFTPVGLGDLTRIRPGAQRFLSQALRRHSQKQKRATDNAAELRVDFTFPEPNRGTHHG